LIMLYLSHALEYGRQDERRKLNEWVRE